MVAEIPYSPPVPIDDVLAVAKDFQNADACYRLETWWDLWQFDMANGSSLRRAWRCAALVRSSIRAQRPSRFARSPRTPVIAFPNPDDDAAIGCALEIEFGIDANFLPQPDLPDSPRMIESNIKSLLKLVHDLDDALPVETRRLWSESGENFAEKLHQALTAVAE